MTKIMRTKMASSISRIMSSTLGTPLSSVAATDIQKALSTNPTEYRNDQIEDVSLRWWLGARNSRVTHISRVYLMWRRRMLEMKPRMEIPERRCVKLGETTWYRNVFRSPALISAYIKGTVSFKWRREERIGLVSTRKESLRLRG
jgi:hypothetical protein